MAVVNQVEIGMFEVHFGVRPSVPRRDGAMAIARPPYRSVGGVPVDSNVTPAAELAIQR